MPRHLDPDSRALPKATSLSAEGQNIHHFADSLAVDGGSIRQRQDDFLLTASHVLQNPHNYTPRHGHSTRYKQWYSSTFSDDRPGRSSVRRLQGDQQTSTVLLFSILVCAVAYFVVLPGLRGGVTTDPDVFSAFNSTFSAEIQARFSEVDLSQKALMLQLNQIKLTMSSHDSLTALEKLRNELDELTLDQSSTSAAHESIESGWSLIESDVGQAEDGASSLRGTFPSHDSLGSAIQDLKQQISALASAVSNYSTVSKALQEEVLSRSTLSPQVVDEVKTMVRSAVLENWLMDDAGKVKENILSDLSKDILEASKATHEEVVDNHVREAVSAAINSNAPSKVEASVTNVLRALLKERLSGVDWLLAINGARITDHSRSFDACSGMDMASRMLCSAKNNLAVPVQLNPNTILKPDGGTAVQGDGANGLRLGQCWAMSGSSGFVEVMIFFEHIPKDGTVES